MKNNKIFRKLPVILLSAMIFSANPVMSDASAFSTIQTVEAATVKTPSTVKLRKISSPAYNKIKESWKKAKNATKYYVYYRKSGTKKWKKIASVKSSATSYTHTASYKYPLTVGQKYDYTVKAYNSKTKKSGKYNTKGLTVKTVPNAVTNFTPLVLSNNTVQLTWTRSLGADKYVVYRKASSNAKWQKLATINSTYYVDKAPVVNQESYYMVKPYVSKYKVYGKYDADGVKVYVKHNTPTPTPSPKPTTKPEQPSPSPTETPATPSPKPTTKPEQPTVTPKPTEKPVTPSPEPTKKPEPTATPSPSPKPTETPVTPTPTEKPQPTETPAPTPSPKPVANPELMTQEVIRLTNIERAKEGEAPLQYHAGLQKAAMLRAQEISIKFAHVRPDGSDSSTAVFENGVGCSNGENIARGYTSPEAVVQGWMNSVGHKAAILRESSTHIGVGFYQNSYGTYFWVQDFSYGPDEKRTVTCDANDGTFADGNTTSTTAFPCDMHVHYADLPVPTRDGYTFDGWMRFGQKVTGMRLMTNVNLTASWVPNN